MSLPTCERAASVQESLERMVRYGRYKCLVVDAENRLEGIVTVMDLLGEDLSKEALEVAG